MANHHPQSSDLSDLLPQVREELTLEQLRQRVWQLHPGQELQTSQRMHPRGAMAHLAAYLADGAPAGRSFTVRRSDDLIVITCYDVSA